MHALLEDACSSCRTPPLGRSALEEDRQLLRRSDGPVATLSILPTLLRSCSKQAAPVVFGSGWLDPSSWLPPLPSSSRALWQLYSSVPAGSAELNEVAELTGLVALFHPCSALDPRHPMPLLYPRSSRLHWRPASQTHSQSFPVGRAHQRGVVSSELEQLEQL